MATQNVVNLNQSYFPMYLTETLHFNKVYHYLKYISLTFSSLNVRVFCVRRASRWFFFVPCIALVDWESKRRSGEVLSAIKWGLEVAAGGGGFVGPPSPPPPPEDPAP